MEERRRAKRMPVALSLEISNLFKQDNAKVSDLHAPIEVTNISKLGMAFESKCILPIGYYFDANINLASKDTLRCVVKIIRNQEQDNGKILYGCEFVGIASVLSYIFEEYEKRLDSSSVQPV